MGEGVDYKSNGGEILNQHLSCVNLHFDFSFAISWQSPRLFGIKGNSSIGLS